MIGERRRHDQYDWPAELDSKIELSHKLMNDLRRRIWVAGIKPLGGMYATEDLMDQPKSDWVWTDGDGDPDFWYEDRDARTGWWGRPSLGQYRFGIWGGMRCTIPSSPSVGTTVSYSASADPSHRGFGVSDHFGDIISPNLENVRANFDGPHLASVQSTTAPLDDPWGPGSVTCWHEESFTHTCTKIDATNQWFEFTWTQDLEDDLRVGTPFRLTATAQSNYYLQHYRVSSATQVSSVLRVEVSKLDGTEFSWLAEDHTTLIGSAVCDFGGDWYTLNSWKQWDWLTYTKDGVDLLVYDHAVKIKRPPTGGIISNDDNSHWIRTLNPNWYHHSDTNCHRVRCSNDLGDGPGYQEYESEIAASEFLCKDVDPIERRPPTGYVDSGRLKWWYDDKVEIKKEQITAISQTANEPSIGAMYDTIETGTSTAASVGRSKDDQYRHWYTKSSGLSWIAGTEPYKSSQYQYEGNKEYAYCLGVQNMVELVAQQGEWSLPVDDDYKENWITLHASTIPEWYGDATLTYAQILSTYGLDAAYQPLYEPDQPEYALLTDEIWGCNGAAIELLLKANDEYDWYYDDVHPYESKRLLNLRWKAVDQAIGDEQKALAAADYPEPIGTWRRTFKRSMGQVRPSRMVEGSYTPSGDDYGDAGGIYEWVGIFVDTEPAATIFYDYTTNSVSVTAVGPNGQFTKSGNYTSTLTIGTTLWENKTTSYQIIESTYDGVYTTVLVKNCSGGTKTFYLDTTISSRHDGCGIESQTSSYYDDVLWILNDCHELLDKLQYQVIMATITKLEWRWVDFYAPAEEKISYPTVFDSPEDCIVAWRNHMETIRPDFNTSDWADAGTYLEINQLLEFDEYLGDWEIVPESVNQEVLLKVAASNFDLDLTKNTVHTIGFRLGIEATADPANEGEIAPRMITSTGLELTGEYQKVKYGYITVRLDLDVDNELCPIVHCKLDNVSTAWVDPQTSVDGMSNSTGRLYPVLGQNQLLLEFNFDKYDEQLFKRDTTFRNVEPQDPLNDNDPPIDSPSLWWEQPVLYDSNRENGLKSYERLEMYEEGSSYVPEWRIRMSCYPAEDLASPPVTYILTHDGGDGTVDLSTTNSMSEFDLELDLEVGSAGTHAQVVKAFLEDMLNWTFNIKVQDADSPVNTTVATSDAGISAEDGRIAANRCCWAIEPEVRNDGNDYHYMEAGAFGPLGGSTVEYKFEESIDAGSTVNSTRAYSTTNSWAVDDDPPTQHFRVMARSGIFTTEWSGWLAS